MGVGGTHYYEEAANRGELNRLFRLGAAPDGGQEFESGL